jgi:hypothetical protein
VENSAAHIPKAALHALAVIAAKPALRPLRSAGQMGRAKLVKCQHRGQSSPAVYSVPPLLEGAKTVSFSEQALVSLLGCPDAASWSGERRIRFELGVLSVADTWNPSDDERNAARDFCAPQGPLQTCASPTNTKQPTLTPPSKFGNSESSLMNRGPAASCRPRLAADDVRRT